MRHIKDSFYSDRSERRKDAAPSTNWFLLAVPLLVILAVACRVEPPVEPAAPLFDLPDSALICVLGVCL